MPRTNGPGDGDSSPAEDELASERRPRADGGLDVSTPFTYEDIEPALREYENRTYPDRLMVDDVEALLTVVQYGAERSWDAWMDRVEAGDWLVVAEADDAVVFDADEYTAVGLIEGVVDELLDVQYDDVAATVVEAVLQNAAERYGDGQTEVSNPVVAGKPPSFDAGQRFVEAVVNGYVARGCPPEQAWAIYGVHVAGTTENEWRRRGEFNSRDGIWDLLRDSEADSSLPYVE
jgi:hypothetical protein